jgi:hypothetical protein
MMMLTNKQADTIYSRRFRASADHLAALLNWMRRLLAWHIDLTRYTYGTLADDSYRGLYIPSVEIDILGTQEWDMPVEFAQERAGLSQERLEIEEAALAAEREGLSLPLRHVARLFNLTPFEQDVLLLTLAPELDLRFERLYAYIQDDVSRRRPSVDLALRLLCSTPAERIARMTAFEHDAPLLRRRLIALFEDGQRRPALPARFIKLDERIAAELRGGAPPPIDALIAPCVAISRPTRTLEELLLPDGLAERLRRSFADGVVLALQGGYGSGRRVVAEALCAAAGLPLLVIDLDQLLGAESSTIPGIVQTPEECVGRIVREALLRGAAMVWRGADGLLHDDTRAAWRTAALTALDEHAGRSILLIERSWEAGGALPNRRYLRVELPPLSYGQREQIWRLRLNGDRPDDSLIAALASTFRLSGGQIRDAVAMARSLARWRAFEEQPMLSAQDLYAACRAQSSGRLGALAYKISATYDWDDIVLPNDQINRLREICIQVRNRRTVLETWGFDRRLSMGKGVNTLFAGPSGAGKTMAAEIIAADLGLDLYKIDLSSMVSKYIGETEKNLDQVFSAAREANAILFFDEADALFGKRSEVKDAHDRYANIEVGYLLQKMEEYDGVVILATNLRKNMDDAFVRRLHVTVDFPFPEEDDRLRIWRKVFPREAPLAEDVDLPFLARQFKLTGGNIRNIALLAAFLAAEEGAVIGMDQVIRAIRREYQKIGKLVTAAEFGRYLALLRE